MTGGPRYQRYPTGRGEEWIMALGPLAGPQLVIVQPLFEEMNRFLTSKQLRPVIDKTFPFADLPEALSYLASGKQFGKVAVVF